MEEIWKDIPGFEGYYQASDLGRVKSLRRKIVDSVGHEYFVEERIMKAVFNKKIGYLRVIICKNGTRKTTTVHRIVALAHLPNPENKRTVNHKDGDKLNNCISNLEWATTTENIRHAFKQGLMRGHARYGGKNPAAKRVVQKSIDGSIIKIWPCITHAGVWVSGYKKALCNALKTGRPKGGYIWEYEKK